MNAQVRTLTTVIIALFLVLAGSLTVVQYAQAPTLNADGRNSRTLYREYGRERGPIVVGGQAVVTSVPVDDPFGQQRTYANGPLYAPVTGYYSVVLGTRGIEKTESQVLNGTADSLFLSRIQHLITGKQQRGGNVELTLNPAVQQAAWDALGDRTGAAVAIDPTTGAVLAVVTKPTYDPNVLASHDTAAVNQAYQAMLNDPSRPLDNRALASYLYPPGSTFKLVTAAAAIESGQYAQDTVVPAPTTYTLPGTSTQMHNFGNKACSASGEMTLADALKVSCNTAFAELGVGLGDDALRNQAEAFGFNQPLAIPLTVTPSVYPLKELDDAQTALTAIGQYEDRATPLQMAMVAAAIANHGTLMQPYLVARETDADLNQVAQAQPQVLSTPISRSTADQLTSMMLGVVKGGTGTKAQISGVEVAGKTGTAEGASGAAPDAWFVGFAPANNPSIAVAVVVEGAGSLSDENTGGAVAAPIARAMIQAALG